MNIFIFIYLFLTVKFSKANSEGPDRASQKAPVELGLCCLHMPPKRLSSLKRVYFVFR